MKSKEEYFAINSEDLQKRTAQIKELLSSLNISSVDTAVSLGCGTAAELPLIKAKNKIGVDHNPSVIDFCKETHKAEFVCSDGFSYLDKLNNESVDLIFALDIDTNMIPLLLIKQAMSKLKQGGSIIITERENNIKIYNRMLLLPFIDEIT